MLKGHDRYGRHSLGIQGRAQGAWCNVHGLRREDNCRGSATRVELLLGRYLHVQRLHTLLQRFSGSHVIHDLQPAGQVTDDATFDVIADIMDRTHVADDFLGAFIEACAVFADDGRI